MFRSFIKVTGWEKDILGRMKKRLHKKEKDAKKR
jgi:hypothetical protein